MKVVFSISLLALLVSATMSLRAAEDVPRPWSFAPLGAREAPAVTATGWPRTRIDNFLLARIEEAGLSPAPPAGNRTLVRRLHFDLTGLPPKPRDVEQFDGDVEALVERLLASPHYGERWGRYWLDLARYTDVTASWLDSTADAWLYRDWVVTAFNDDMPYDEFVVRQLATDLLPETDPADNAALGFLGLSPTYWKELQLPPDIIKGTVADEWEEHVDALGKTFLGLTLGCARCHDHKNDPVSAHDYYALAGVFASIQFADRPTISDDLWNPVARARERVAQIESQIETLKKKKPEHWEKQVAEAKEQIAEIAASTPHYDTPMANGVIDAALYVMPKAEGQHGTILDYRKGQARDLPFQERGDPNLPGEIVPRGFLSAFPLPGSGEPRRFTRGSGRLELAEALTGEAAPLTARVIVNRIWRHHFGRGLVATPSDFGNGGEPPSHPDLLDDLAHRFVANGWSLKWLHREILLSAAWRQSCRNEAAARHDPRNVLHARADRRRLDIEAWRDALLLVSGDLDPTPGGEPVDLSRPDTNRRTLYGRIHRRDLDAMLRLHDFPDPAAHSPKRIETTTPLQALFSLNSPFFAHRAERLAARITRDHPDSVPDRLDRAYQLLFQRMPSQSERDLALSLVASDDPDDWTLLCHALLASNEFLFLD